MNSILFNVTELIEFQHWTPKDLTKLVLYFVLYSIEFDFKRF